MKTIITESANLEKYLTPYKDLIGPDYDGYRNHLYRVLNYAIWFLDGDTSQQEIMEFALVFHDIGLWTDKELAYLEPSIQEAKRVLYDQKPGFDINTVTDLIYFHHKITAYKGPNQELVNAFRKADWVDATKGKISKGMPASIIKKVNAAIPAAGFYDTLDRLGPELTNNKKLTMVGKFLRVFKF